MRRLAKISFIIVLFGQFGFSAAAYYLNVAHPSWPFWVALYAVSGLLVLGHTTQPKLTTPDLFFCAFIGYVVISFLILGQSNQSEFAQRLLLICVAPYVCSRIVGKYTPFSLSLGLQVLSLLYLLLIGVELARNPDLFQADRLFLFTDEDWDRVGGNPTAFNIGMTLGAAWVAVFAYLVGKGEQKSVLAVSRTRPWLLVIVFGFPAVLLLIGSRTSVVSIVLCAVVLLGFASWISTRVKVGLLVATIAGLLFIYSQLPEQRKLLIDEIPATALEFSVHTSDVSACAPGGSVYSRLAQLSEAGRLFVESPIFGIGATNFGFRFCGEETEFASPHSISAHVLVEYGLVGAGLIALMFANIVHTFLRRMRSPGYRARSAAWGLFGVWIFAVIQVQFIGNLFYDYQVFLLTGLFVSCLYYGDRWAPRPNLTQGHAAARKRVLRTSF